MVGACEGCLRDAHDGDLSAERFIQPGSQAGTIGGQVDVAVDENRLHAIEHWQQGLQQARQLSPIEFARDVFRDVGELHDVLLGGLAVGLQDRLRHLLDTPDG